MQQMKKLVLNGTEYTVTDGSAVAAPATARVGQTVVVKSVDESGRPTAWEAADLPGGSNVVVANFIAYSAGVLQCLDYTNSQLMHMHFNGKIIIAHVAIQDECDMFLLCSVYGSHSDQTEVFFVGNDSLGWAHYPEYDSYFADGDITNQTAGNELWMEV